MCSLTQRTSNISFLHLWQVFGRRACHPKEILDFVGSVDDNDYHNFMAKLNCRKECEKVIFNHDMSVALANMKPLEYLMQMSNQTYTG